jgi:thymidylate synthase (FAD)
MPEPLVRIDNILDDGIGFVELWDQLGDDQRIAAAARVSLNRELSSLADSSEEQQLRDIGLVARLIRDRHTSPFRHVVFQWRVRLPIFVERQWKEHRAGSDYNTESGRYSELKNEFYVPKELRVQVGKSMDYRFERMNDKNAEMWLLDSMANRNEGNRQLYETLLSAAVAREQAREVLSVAQYTTFIWTVNALALLHFLHLRNSPHAQAEIRAYAQSIEGVLAERLPVTYAAYKQHWGDGIAMIV